MPVAEARTAMKRAIRTVILFLLTLVVACSGGAATPVVPGAPVVDRAWPLRGVPDPGADPAVLLLDLDGQGWCTGALLASDVVLTARRCVSVLTGDPSCPARGAQVSGGVDLTNVRVLVGVDAATAQERARGRAVLVPDGDVLCGADLALLLLDGTIDDVAPLVVQPTGAAVGDHVRSVAFESGQQLVRDHVSVVAVSAVEIELAEAPCDATPGGPAIDETSGQVVGVISRSGPSCGAADGYDVDSRTDAFLMLVQEALAEGQASHASHQAKEKKGAVDLGASCTRGADCAAGACVSYAGAEYCTRTCDPTDKCPSKYKCMGAQSGSTVCVQE
jgi:hypothetical protein